VVLAAVVGFVGFLYLPKRIGPVTLGKIDIEQNSLVMETPKISGFHGDEQMYEVSASRAVQRLDDPSKVRLDDLEGTIGLNGGETATVVAGTGLYDTAAEVLTLSGGIAINTTQGYEAHLEDATIDFSAETMRSDRPVSLVTPDGTISGNAIEISDGGHRILVTGSVKVTLYATGMPTLRGTDVADASRIPVAP
jgi:lipopolysaccharide export system protein LptC